MQNNRHKVTAMDISRLLRQAVIAGVVLLSSGFSLAAEIDIYGGLGLGYAVQDENAPNTNTADTGGKVYVGMRLLGPLGIEASYYDLGTYNNGTEAVNGTSVAAVGNLDIRGMTLFAKAGVIAWSEKSVSAATELSGDDMTYGIGINLPVARHVLLRTEWEHFTRIGKNAPANDPGKDMSLLSFGVNFRF